MALLFICLFVSFVTLTTSSRVGQNENFHFRGLIAPVFTPFNNDADQTVNLLIIQQYAEHLKEKNITGILVGGTTGEGLSLSIEERKKLVEAWAIAVKKTQQHLMVQVGGAALSDVKDLAAHAESLKVDSLLCLPDLYLKPTRVEYLVEYLSYVAASAPRTPLIYYQSAKVQTNVEPGELVKLAANTIPTFAGIKLDSSDARQAVDVLAANNEMIVFYGSKMVITAGCAIGVDSFMSATLNFLPKPSIELMNFCDGNMDLKTAQKKQSFLNKIERIITQHGGYVEAMKTAMSLTTNLFMGQPRRPLKGLSRLNIEEMLEELRDAGLITNNKAAFMLY